MSNSETTQAIKCLAMDMKKAIELLNLVTKEIELINESLSDGVSELYTITNGMSQDEMELNEKERE